MRSHFVALSAGTGTSLVRQTDEKVPGDGREGGRKGGMEWDAISNERIIRQSLIRKSLKL